MGSYPGAPGHDPAGQRGGDTRGGQRFGHVTGRRPDAAGPGAHPGTYLVRDDETGITYTFGYTEIVTEGLRTIRTGERVRFLIDDAHPGHAAYVIRLDLPDTAEYYK
jgi:hypothetical protein